MKKLYVVILAVVACVLLTEMIYLGVVFTKKGKSETETPTGVLPAGNSISYSDAALPDTESDAYSAPSSPEQTGQSSTWVLSSDPTKAPYDAPYSAADTPQQTGTTVPSSEAQESYTLQDVIAAMQTAVNYAKSAKNFTGVKTVDPGKDVGLTNLPTMLNGPANTILKRFLYERTGEYVFVNGMADDVGTDKKGDLISANDAIQPEGRPFALQADGIASYSVEPSGDKTVYRVTLVPEATTLAEPEALYHSTVMDCFDLTGFDISPAKINYANIHYFGSTVIVIVDENGLPLVYTVITPASGTGEGSLLGITASGTLSGTLTESWEFSF